jgi:hypothetical protein
LGKYLILARIHCHGWSDKLDVSEIGVKRPTISILLAVNALSFAARPAIEAKVVAEIWSLARGNASQAAWPLNR